MVGNSSFWIGRLNLVLFYILGKYYRLSQRAAGIHLVFAFFFMDPIVVGVVAVALLLLSSSSSTTKEEETSFFSLVRPGDLKVALSRNQVSLLFHRS